MSDRSETPESPVHRSPVPKGKMLPGIAGIMLFLLFLTLANVYGALTNAFGTGRGKYGVLGLCSLLVIGLFGLLSMKRWGWAFTCAGCVLLSAGYFYVWRLTHGGFFMVQGCFMLVFFLYLVRPEVRDRMI